MVNYKNKYLKYKLKYLKLKGGMESIEGNTYFEGVELPELTATQVNSTFDETEFIDIKPSEYKQCNICGIFYKSGQEHNCIFGIPEKCNTCGYIHVIETGKSCPHKGFTIREVKTKNQSRRPLIGIIRPIEIEEEPIPEELLEDKEFREAYEQSLTLTPIGEQQEECRQLDIKILLIDKID